MFHKLRSLEIEESKPAISKKWGPDFRLQGFSSSLEDQDVEYIFSVTKFSDPYPGSDEVLSSQFPTPHLQMIQG